mgnify:CR=1 FL=1|jgi:hypothetical protein
MPFPKYNHYQLISNGSHLLYSTSPSVVDDQPNPLNPISSPEGHCCNICNLTYGTMLDLKDHRKKKHPIEYPSETNIFNSFNLSSSMQVVVSNSATSNLHLNNGFTNPSDSASDDTSVQNSTFESGIRFSSN